MGIWGNFTVTFSFSISEMSCRCFSLMNLMSDAAFEGTHLVLGCKKKKKSKQKTKTAAKCIVGFFILCWWPIILDGKHNRQWVYIVYILYQVSSTTNSFIRTSLTWARIRGSCCLWSLDTRLQTAPPPAGTWCRTPHSHAPAPAGLSDEGRTWCCWGSPATPHLQPPGATVWVHGLFTTLQQLKQ